MAATLPSHTPRMLLLGYRTPRQGCFFRDSGSPSLDLIATLSCCGTPCAQVPPAGAPLPVSHRVGELHRMR